MIPDPSCQRGFKAGSDEGEFRIDAAVGDARTQTTVVISKKEAPRPPTAPAPSGVKGLRWSGQVLPQKWMNFYTKVLARYATMGGLKLTVTFEIAPDGGLLPQRSEETRAALRELGLDDNVSPLS